MYDREEVAKLKFNCFFLSHQRNNLCSSHCCNQDEERKCDELYHGNYSLLWKNIDHIILERSLTCTVFQALVISSSICSHWIRMLYIQTDGLGCPFGQAKLLELPHRPVIHPDHPSHGKKWSNKLVVSPFWMWKANWGLSREWNLCIQSLVQQSKKISNYNEVGKFMIVNTHTEGQICFLNATTCQALSLYYC